MGSDDTPPAPGRPALPKPKAELALPDGVYLTPESAEEAKRQMALKLKKAEIVLGNLANDERTTIYLLCRIVQS